MNIQVDPPFEAQGDAPIKEDRYAIRPAEPLQLFLGDGVSGLYLPKEGPRTFFGLSGGRLATQIASGVFSVTDPDPMETKLVWANEELREVIREEKLSLAEPEFLPGTTFLTLEADPLNSVFRLIIGGDCFAFWRRIADGSVYGTSNTMYAYELELTQKIAELMRGAPGTTLEEKRQNMWREFRPFLAQKRRQAVNQEGGYALLNGQVAFEEALYEEQPPVQFAQIKVEDEVEIIICTDGFIPLTLTENPKQAASFVFRHFDEGKLPAVAQATWQQTAQEEWQSHVSRPEATAIRITATPTP